MFYRRRNCHLKLHRKCKKWNLIGCMGDVRMHQPHCKTSSGRNSVAENIAGGKRGCQPCRRKRFNWSLWSTRTQCMWIGKVRHNRISESVSSNHTCIAKLPQKLWCLPCIVLMFSASIPLCFVFRRFSNGWYTIVEKLDCLHCYFRCSVKVNVGHCGNTDQC